MARTDGKADAFAIFVRPPGWSDDDVKGRLWLRVSAIPGVVPIIDRDATEARRFGAETSGFVLAFDPGGHLAFSGGITPSRGHEGDNPGLQSAVRFVNSGELPEAQAKTPVFGCALFSTRSRIGTEG
jgi:hypothetical protein